MNTSRRSILLKFLIGNHRGFAEQSTVFPKEPEIYGSKVDTCQGAGIHAVII